MQTTIAPPRLLSSLALPRIKQTIVQRQRVTQLLHVHRQKKLIVVTAPAGYGKTTLAIDYAHHNERLCCWLTFDASDSDVSAFVEALVESIGRVFPALADNNHLLPDLHAALQVGESGFAICSRILSNALYRAISDDFDLVLNDYHRVENAPALGRFLSDLFPHLPPQCHVVLTGRDMSALDTTILTAENDIAYIGVNDLKFSWQEICSVFKDVYHNPISEADAVRLADESDGWIIGLVLGLADPTHHEPSVTYAPSAPAITTYLHNTVWRDLPQQLQTFLVQTSLLDKMNVERCNKLCHITNATEMLAECVQRKLFLSSTATSHGMEEGIYHYSPVFRIFLLNKLAQEQPQYLRVLRRTAALVQRTYSTDKPPSVLPLKQPETHTSDSKDVPLAIYGFGVPKVMVYGEAVQHWRAAKASELLMFLANQAKPVRKEAIIDALWPDLDASHAETVFRSALYRLRTAIPTKWIVRTHGQYSIGISIRYDVQLFESLIRQGDKLGTVASSQEDVLHCYQQANALYVGEYMEGVYSEWCIERQRTLSIMYIALLLKQAELELRLGLDHDALATTEKCLAIEADNEAAHRLRLCAYKNMGNETLLTYSIALYRAAVAGESFAQPQQKSPHSFTMQR